MLSRLIAFAVATVVFCFGFASPGQAALRSDAGIAQAERLGQIAQSAQAVQPVPAEGAASLRDLQPGPVEPQGSGDDAGQVQAEAASDMPALIVARLDARDLRLTMSRPRPYAAAAWRAPYLDGPQRPPCATLVAA